MNAYGYVRVSTGDQAMSIQAQRDTIHGYFTAMLAPKGFTWGGWFIDEGVSGKVPIWDRPAGAKLQVAADQGDTILCAKLDRAFRRLSDLIMAMDTLASRGVHMQLLDMGVDTTSDVGKLMVQIMGAFAEWERSRISERQRDSIAVRRKLGLATNGTAPYGSKFSKRRNSTTGTVEIHLVRNDLEREIGETIVEARLQGWAWNAIARHLTKNHVFVCERPWTWRRVLHIHRKEMALREVEGRVKTG